MTREEQIYKKAEGDCIAMLESIERGDIIKGSICPQSYRAGFMDGAKWADQYPHWIPVEEELPKKMANIFSMMRFLDTKCQYIMTGLLLCHQSPTGCRWPKAPRKEADND